MNPVKNQGTSKIIFIIIAIVLLTIYFRGVYERIAMIPTPYGGERWEKAGEITGTEIIPGLIGFGIGYGFIKWIKKKYLRKGDEAQT